MSQTLPDGTVVSVSFTGYRRGQSETDQWDTGQWDTMQWDGGTTPVAYTITPDLNRGFSTRRGKDSFGKKYRVGTFRGDFDNRDGLFTDTGALNPGDYLKVFMTAVGAAPVPPSSTPIPDQTTWDGVTGREWTAHGSLVLHDEGEPQQIATDSEFYGKVNSGQDLVAGGIDVTRIHAQDQLAEFAVAANREAGVAEGGGENTADRIDRIYARFGYSTNAIFQEALSATTMAETTFPGGMLQQLQDTMTAEGGDMWADGFDYNPTGDGRIQVRMRDWLTTLTRSTTIQWVFGGAMGLPLQDAKITRNLARVFNDTEWQNTVDGAPSTSQDLDSINQFGRRSFNQLGMVGDDNLQAQFLADRFVTEFGELRNRVETITMIVQDFDTAQAALEAEFGDLVLIFVDSIHGWGRAAQAHIIGIEHEYVGKRWKVTFTVADTGSQDETTGPFDNEMFNDSFDLGEV